MTTLTEVLVITSGLYSRHGRLKNHQDYKWKDAVFGFATKELAKDPEFQKEWGVHISAIKMFS